ncbi:transposase, IS110 family protein [Klebsiella pneumoniae]|nr:transposase, IS110 family protein [Klebsiella pneumoniae]
MSAKDQFAAHVGLDWADKKHDVCVQFKSKRAARTVLTGMCYSVGSATRQGSSSLTRFIGQSAMTSRT